MDEHQLFPQMPDTFEGLSDEDLAGLITGSREAMAKIRSQDPEHLGDLSAHDVLEAMKTVVSNIQALEALQAERKAANANLDTELSSLAAQVEPEETLAAEGDEEPEGDDKPEGDEAAAELAAEGETEPVVAAAEEPVVENKPIRRRMPAQGRHQAVDLTMTASAPQGPQFKALSGLPDFAAGTEFDLHEGIGDNSLNFALGDAIRDATMYEGGYEKVRLAKADIRGQVPEHRQLYRDQDGGNQNKIDALVAAAKQHGVGYDGDDWAEAEALTASGGICAPVTPYYQLAFISEMDRPVRDSLVGFVADRGGINFAPPPYLSQITTGVGVITASQDAAGGTSGTKTCQTLICPAFQIVDVQSIFHCYQGGNLGQRAFPEQAAQFSSLILAQHARVAETQLLNQIKAGSTNVLGQSSVLGAFSSLLNDMIVAAAAYRSNNRMDRNAPLQAIVPQWTSDLLLIDLLQSNFYRFDKDLGGLDAFFASINLRVTFTKDGPTDGEGQILARQTGSLGPSAPGALTPFPTVVEWALFHPGAWLFVDSGVLELGIVRDSVLNATNSYQVFGESWEAAAGVGVQSEWITSNVCPTGATALSISNTHQCGT